MGVKSLSAALRTPSCSRDVTLENEPNLFPVFMDEKTLYEEESFVLSKSCTSVFRPDEAVSNWSHEKEFYFE